ncbi:MAG: hypothetical protein ACPGMR_03205 [Pontibacterium sp.]
MPRIVYGQYAGKQQAFVQKYGGDERLGDVHANIDAFSFHSDFLPFMEIGFADGAVTLPQLNPTFVSTSVGKDDVTKSVPVEHINEFLVPGIVCDSQQDYVIGYEKAGGSLIGGATMVQKVGESHRTVSIRHLGSSLYIRDRGITGRDTLPAFTLNYRIHAFRVDASYKTHPGTLAELRPQRVIFAEGRFDSDRRYLYKDPPSDQPKIVLPTQKTVNMEVVVHDGTTYPERLSVGYRFNGASFWYGMESSAPSDHQGVSVGVL